MITCPNCKSENSDEERFCSDCGEKFDENLLKTEFNLKVNAGGRLVFPDDESYEIDDSQRLIGRADLQKFTKEDPTLISRSHFTIYRFNGKYVIKDGVTNVQNKPSEKSTFVNGKKIDSKELENEDKINVSDVELSFVI
tara:strand:- start:145 stop:561 length:417 start_codon:yes stop_codon:yes gene_type:complete